MTVPSVIVLDNADHGETWRWIVAATIVVAAHAAVAASSMLFHSPESTGSPEAPAVIIDLSPTPVSPASLMDVAPGPESIESQPTPRPAATEEPPDPTIEAPPVETPVVALEPERPKSDVKPDETQPDKLNDVKPAPIAQQRELSTIQSAPPKARRVANAPAAPRVGSSAQRNVDPSWVSRLMAHLNRHKQYPSVARAQREQGTVVVSFTISRNGRVLSKRVSKSSGSSALDQEALAMLQRAQPLPQFPADMTGEARTFSAPIRFSLQ